MVEQAQAFFLLCHPPGRMKETTTIPTIHVMARVVYDAWYMYIASRMCHVSPPPCCPSCGYFPDVIVDGRMKTAMTLGRDALQV